MTRTALLFALGCLACQPDREGRHTATGAATWNGEEIGADCFAVVERDEMDDGSIDRLEVYQLDPDSGEILDLIHYKGDAIGGKSTYHCWYVLGPTGWIEETCALKGDDGVPRRSRTVTRDEAGRILTDHQYDPNKPGDPGDDFAYAYNERGELLVYERPSVIAHYTYLPDGRLDRVVDDRDKDDIDDVVSVYAWAAPAPNRDATVLTFAADDLDTPLGWYAETWDTEGRLLAWEQDRDDDGVVDYTGAQTWDADGYLLVLETRIPTSGKTTQTTWSRGADGRVLAQGISRWEGGVQVEATRATWHWSTAPSCTWIPTRVNRYFGLHGQSGETAVTPW